MNSRISAQEQCCCGGDEEIEVPGGDFEFSPYPAPGGWIDYTSGFGPWDVSTGSISHHDDGHNNLGAGNPNSSTAHVDLNGFSQGGICQTINGFTIGEECTLSFFYAIHNALSSATATVELDGGNAISDTWDADNVGSNIWLEAIYTFIATDTEMELCFTSNTSVSCCGMLIDDISFSCCPSDAEDPVLDQMPADITVMCLDDIPEEPDIDASDDCSTDLDIEFNEDIEELGCNFNVYRDWSVEDDCGKIVEYTQVISVIDEEEPFIISPPEDLEISCNEDIQEVYLDWIENFGFANIDDNCEDIELTVEHETIPFQGCSETLVTFIFSDPCGNSVEEDAFFEVEDSQDPEFIVLPDNLTIPCDSSSVTFIDNWLANGGGSSIIDDCDYLLTNSFSGNYDSTELVTFTASDFCGNLNIASAQIIHSGSIDTIRIDSSSCDVSIAGIFETFIDSDTSCDSLIIVSIEFIPGDTLELIEYSCDPQDIGNDTMISKNMFGCDSIVYLKTILLQSDSIYLIQNSCDSTEVGFESFVFQNIQGCDSIIYQETILLDSDTSYISQNTCDSTEVGIESFVLQNIQGCDSIIYLETILLDSDTSYISQNTCDPAEAGIESFILQNIQGCDSIVFLNSQYTPNDTFYILFHSCEIETEIYDTSTVAGILCDTILISQTIPILDDTTYLIDFDCSITEAEIFTEILAGMPCDSILITEVIPLERDSTFVTSSSCRIQDLGIDTSYYLNEAGCDSLVITEVLYEPTDPILVDQYSCLEQDIGLDTQTVFSLECDSLIITSTYLLESSESVVQNISCEPTTNDTFLFSNSNGCDSFLIVEYQFQEIFFEYDLEYDPCDPTSTADLFIYNIEGGMGPYQYILNANTISDNPVLVIQDEGEYTISIQDSEDCMSQEMTFTLQRPDDLEISAPSEITILNGQEYQFFISLPSDADSFYWSHPELLSCTDCLDPFVFSDEAVNLELNVISDQGCLSSRTIKIDVKRTGIYIPNIFSPNGDKINDDFGIFHSGSVDVIKSFRIFDRWGNLIFEKINSSPDESSFWDGRYNNEFVSPNVFVYHLEIQMKDGESKSIIGEIAVVR